MRGEEVCSLQSYYYIMNSSCSSPKYFLLLVNLHLPLRVEFADWAK